MPSISITLERKNERHTNVQTAKAQIAHLIKRATAGTRSSWRADDDSEIREPKHIDGVWVYKAIVILERHGRITAADKLRNEMLQIVAYMNKAGNSKGGWVVTESNPVDWKLPVGATPGVPAGDNKEFTVEDIVDFDKTRCFDDIRIPEILISGSNHEIEDYPAFDGIYGRAAHIRVMAAAMQTMISTKGAKRNHAVLYGKPACAKSTLFHAWQSVIGKGSYLAINANSATQAGIESIFLDRLPEVGGCPPFVFIEEIEKTKEEINTVWLSCMDERAEIRKVRHNNLRRVQVRALCFATVNDKVLFDRIMGGRPGSPGALSSRMRGLYVPRPNRVEMKRILLRDIELYYPEGNELWADKCIEIAYEVKTDDPRMILSFLDGRDRLLTEEYKADIISIYEREQEDADEVDDDDESDRDAA